jgi:hypothetical protein
LKTTFRLVGGTDVDPALLESAQPKRKRGRPVQAIEPALDKPLSITAENGHIRKERYDVWRMAEAAVDYWRVRMKLHHALACAQNHDLPEGRLHPPINERDYIPIVEKWRMALVKQLLTPAPTAGAVSWKKAALIQEQFKYVGVKSERIERAIADDLAFLAAHPVRRSNRRRQS